MCVPHCGGALFCLSVCLIVRRPMPVAAAGEAAPDQRRGPRPTDAARPAQRRSGGGHAWQEFRRAALLAKEMGAASVRKHGRSITITYHQDVQRPAPTSAPSPQPESADVASAEKAPRHRPPSWHRRAAARRARFFEAKDFSAVDAALPELFEEAAVITAMVIDAAPATTTADAHAMGPAASAASASALELPSPPEHAAPWSRPLHKGAEPSPGAPFARSSLPSPPSRPPDPSCEPQPARRNGLGPPSRILANSRACPAGAGA